MSFPLSSREVSSTRTPQSSHFATRANLHSSSKNFGTSTHSQEISSAISLGRSGLMGKACRILLSSGIAPSNSTTLNLLQSKNPSCPHPTIPDIDSNPVTLGPSFDILDMSNAFNRVSRQAGVPPSLNCYHGYHGAMVLTPFCGNPWAKSAHSQVFSRGIPLAQCCLLWSFISLFLV